MSSAGTTGASTRPFRVIEYTFGREHAHAPKRCDTGSSNTSRATILERRKSRGGTVRKRYILKKSKNTCLQGSAPMSPKLFLVYFARRHVWWLCMGMLGAVFWYPVTYHLSIRMYLKTPACSEAHHRTPNLNAKSCVSSLVVGETFTFTK